ncbi:glycosyltransferase family 4 protein [Arenibacter lacus]|uniref:glycosyltransferase family 4 protein n=1 Tax=Arenibacter lacus TaxID=2608629 RepID=UPI00123D9190|nr:glycosyltransferase family 4 protein [Arenibacter lacus]
MPGKTKIFLISNMYPSQNNVRYGIFVKNFENALRDDFLIRKIVLTKKDSVLKKAVGYFILYLKILALLFSVKRTDIVYVHFPLHVAPALTVLFLKHKNIVLNFHGSDLVFNSFFTKFLSYFMVPLLHKSHLVVPSKYYKEKFVNDFDISDSKVILYPSGGINREIFTPRKKMNNDRFTVGFVSNFKTEKGWKVFLSAIKIIKEKGFISNLEVIMVGDGPDKFKIDRMIDSLKLDVQLFTNQTQSQLARIYNNMNVFVFPTFRESLGLVGLEAMACGIPVIASNTDGPKEYIKELKNGLLFEKQNVNDLVEKIRIYYELPQQKKIEMAFNCENTASIYDSVKVKTALIDFLHQYNNNEQNQHS